MELAVLFDESRQLHDFHAGVTAYETILRSRVIQESGRTVIVRSGTVLLRLVARKVDEAERALLGDTWRMLEPQRLREAINASSIFCWAIANIDKASAIKLDRSLRPHRSYLGCVAIDGSDRNHRTLFRRSLLLKLRISGTTCHVFHRQDSGEERQQWFFDELPSCGLERIMWEDIGLRATIFDDYDTDDHYDRLESLRFFLTTHLPGKGEEADNILLLLEDLNPRLAAILGTAARSQKAARSSEDCAQVGVSVRRYLEQLADAIFPPRDELVNGRKVGPAETRNRVWAYIDETTATGSAEEKAMLSRAGREFDELYKTSSKGVHKDVTPEITAGLLRRAAVLTAQLLTVDAARNRNAYIGYASRFYKLMIEWRDRLYEDFESTDATQPNGARGTDARGEGS